MKVKFLAKRLITLMLLSIYPAFAFHNFKKAKVNSMFKTSCFFINLRLMMQQVRRKRRLGFHHDKRFENEVIHWRTLFLSNTIFDLSKLRAGHCIFKLLLSTIYEDNFRVKIWNFKQTVLRIVEHRLFIKKSRVYREAYLKKILYREIDMVTQFYNSKNLKSAKIIYKKIVNLD